MNSPSPNTIAATCLGCGCLCDDMAVNWSDTPSLAGGTCAKGQSWLQSALPILDLEHSSVSCHIQGQPADLAAGIDEAVRLLKQARQPLVFGMDGVDIGAMRAAVAIADWIGAIVDASHPDYLAATLAMQRVGMVTATLGEVRSRADLVIFWGSDPLVTHPRHLERYSRTSHVADRQLIVIDDVETATANQADRFIRLPANSHFDAICLLRSILKDMPLNESDVQRKTGQPLATWLEIAAQLKSAKYGAFFFGPGITAGTDSLAKSQGLLQLTRELNQFARFVCLLDRPTAYSASAENVLAWRTGFPAAVNLAAEFPRYDPDGWTADKSLARGEVDTAICVGSISQVPLSPPAQSHLESIPRVAVAPRHHVDATISIQVAWPGVHHLATLDRLDNVPITAPAIVAAKLPSAAEVLWQLEKRLRPPAAQGSN